MSVKPVRIVRLMAASPEEIFDAWTDPESLAVWMAPGSVERAEVELEARVGGRFRIVMKSPDSDDVHTGEYLVLDRPHKLAFTWISAQTQGRATTVSIELRRHGKGQTELTLVHEDLPDETAAGRHRSGWEDILEKLGMALIERRGHA